MCFITIQSFHLVSSSNTHLSVQFFFKFLSLPLFVGTISQHMRTMLFSQLCPTARVSVKELNRTRTSLCSPRTSPTWRPWSRTVCWTNSWRTFRRQRQLQATPTHTDFTVVLPWKCSLSWARCLFTAANVCTRTFLLLYSKLRIREWCLYNEQVFCKTQFAVVFSECITEIHDNIVSHTHSSDSKRNTHFYITSMRQSWIVFMKKLNLSCVLYVFVHVTDSLPQVWISVFSYYIYIKHESHFIIVASVNKANRTELEVCSTFLMHIITVLLQIPNLHSALTFCF